MATTRTHAIARDRRVRLHATSNDPYGPLKASNCTSVVVFDLGRARLLPSLRGWLDRSLALWSSRPTRVKVGTLRAGQISVPTF
jgi:hypothetical protein